uniref:Tetraspanin n=1 Tax=Nothoprocta perdicaria TaxID=30464 RepID=A0A8C6ZTB0_NOTPE
MGLFTFIKVMMILFNLAIFLGGATLLGVGIWVVVDGESFFKIFGAISTSVLQVVNVSYFLIVIGAILLIIGFLGCCGAQKESKCLLMTFFTVVLIIFIAEIAAAVVALVYTGLVSAMFESWAGLIGDLWDLHCCGLNNYTDLSESPWVVQRKSYPAPCCSGKQPCSESLAHLSDVPGCFDQLLTEIRKNSGVVGGVAAGIAALEIASMVVAMYLYCRLDEK